MNEFERRKKAIADAILKLSADGHMGAGEAAKAIIELPRCSASEVATMYRLFVTEAHDDPCARRGRNK